MVAYNTSLHLKKKNSTEKATKGCTSPFGSIQYCVEPYIYASVFSHRWCFHNQLNCDTQMAAVPDIHHIESKLTKAHET